MRRLYPIVLFIVSLIFLTSCGEDNGFTEPITVPTGFVAAVNVVSDSPELLFAGTGRTIGQLNYLQASDTTQVIPQVPVSYTVFYLSNRRQATLLEADFTVDIDRVATILLTGTMAAPIPVLVGSRPQDQNNTDTRIVFVNASSIDSATLTLTIPDAATQNIVLPLREVVDTSHTAAGTGLSIEIQDTATGTPLWASGEFNLIPSSENLFILSDYFGPGEEKVRLTSVSNALAFPNEPLNSAIRVGNMVSDRGPLDISVDGILVESNQSFRSMGEYQSISPGDHEFTVSIPGDPTNIIATSTRTLAPGDFLTLAASGHEDSNSVSLTEDNRRPVPSRARLQLTNVSSSAGAIDFYVVDAGESISSSLPLAAGLEELKQVVVELEAGSFDLVVTNIGSAEPLLGPVPVTLDNNNIYSLILTDADGGGEPIQFVLLDDFN